MRHLFLINPTAGKSDCTARMTKAIRAFGDAIGMPCEILISKAAGDITRMVREAGETGEEVRIYACGGDGTMNEAVTGARGFGNLSVTSIPCGSGNDYIRYFSDRSLFEDLMNFREIEERQVDLMDVDGHCCAGICSAGLDARIGTSIDAYRRFPLLGGSRAYTASIVVNLVKGINKPCRVELEDGTVVDEELALCCVCNASWYGGGFRPVPDADIEDGILDVLVVKRVSRLTVAAVISAYQKGRYADYPHLITRYRTKQLRITTPEIEPVNVDGELRLLKDFTVTVQPRALRFFAPKGAW